MRLDAGASALHLSRRERSDREAIRVRGYGRSKVLLALTVQRMEW